MRIVLVLGVAAVVAALAFLRPAAPSAPPAAWTTPLPAHSARPVALAAVVYVAGQVRRPGVYRLAPGARAEEAVAHAGGALPNADLVAVNLAAPVRDGDEIVVPAKGAAALPRPRRSRAPRGSARRGRSTRTPAHAPPPDATVDLNAADATSLASLPGVGPALAARIVAFRDLNGPFRSADELLDVAGITEHRYAEIAPYVTAR